MKKLWLLLTIISSVAIASPETCETMLQNKEYKEAINCCKEELNENRKNWQCYYVIAKTYEATNDKENMSLWLDRGIKYTNSDIFYFESCFKDFKDKNFSAAIKNCETGLSINQNPKSKSQSPEKILFVLSVSYASLIREQKDSSNFEEIQSFVYWTKNLIGITKSEKIKKASIDMMDIIHHKLKSFDAIVLKKYTHYRIEVDSDFDIYFIDDIPKKIYQNIKEKDKLKFWVLPPNEQSEQNSKLVPIYYYIDSE